MCTSGSSQRYLYDMDLTNWFTTDSLSDNLRTVIGRVVLTPEPEVSPISYDLESEFFIFNTDVTISATPYVWSNLLINS